MKTRIVVLALACALTAPAIAGGIAYGNVPQKVFKKKYEWNGALHIAENSQYVPTPTPVHYITIAEPALMSARSGFTTASDENLYEHFTKMALTKFSYTSPLNFGVAEYKRTNRFVKSQTGSRPLHTNADSVRNI